MEVSEGLIRKWDAVKWFEYTDYLGVYIGTGMTLSGMMFLNSSPEIAKELLKDATLSTSLLAGHTFRKPESGGSLNC